MSDIKRIIEHMDLPEGTDIETVAAAAHAVGVPIFCSVDVAQVFDDRDGLVHEQGGLVDDGDALEVAVHIEARGVAAGKSGVELGALFRGIAGDDAAEQADRRVNTAQF